MAVLLVFLGLCWGIEPVTAGSFTAIRIGDADGFGFGTASGAQAANGGSANVDGAGILGVGDFLVDRNTDGKVDEKNGDSFDWRSGTETGGSLLTGSGFVNQGSTGSQFTDLTLSGKSQTARFTFDFTVNTSDVDPTTSVYFNLVFGDYDTGPTSVRYTFADASTLTQNLTKMGQGHQNDGKIQDAYTPFDFDNVFAAVDGGYAGYLDVEFVSSDDFIGIDFAELGATNVTPAGAPEPHVWAMLGVGMVGLFGYRKWGARVIKDTAA